ncbi:MAG: hypothetical protein EXR21_07875 [Flavobacteriaceae bacterium]|nr:hypothetical protein [Flavobacteriaceae bacterium]
MVAKIAYKDKDLFEYNCYQGVDTARFIHETPFSYNVSPLLYKYKVNLSQYRRFVANEFNCLRVNIQELNVASNSPIFQNLLRFRSFDSCSIYLTPASFNLALHHMRFFDREELLFKLIIDQNSGIINNLGVLRTYQEAFRYNGLKGRTDFVFEDKIVEMKQTSSKSLSTKDFLQIFMYALIARTKEYRHLESIQTISFYYPLYNEILHFNINDLLQKVPTSADDFLDGFIDFVFEKGI